MPKSIFISYADADLALATDLHQALIALVGADSFVRDLHMDGGDIIVEALNDAVSDAKFFLIIMSSHAANSPYIRTEANWASFRAIEDLGVRIIVIRTDSSPLPANLEVALGSKFTIDLSTVEPRTAFVDIAEYIEKHIEAPKSNGVYVDRGEPSDDFSLIARRNKLIFILGPNGIGKTAFVNHSVSQRLEKRPISVRLSRGHSLDVICRQIIKNGHILQPSKDASDTDLLALALDALSARSDRFFLFLDNAEEALDAFNSPLPHIMEFAKAFIDADIDTHMVLATTRTPDIPASWGTYADVLVLSGLDERFVREEIELLISDEEKIKELDASSDYRELIRLASGYPLAAKLLSSLLRTRTPAQLIQKDEWHKFELKLALHILQITNVAVLGDCDRALLQVLSTMQTPMTVQDLMASSDLAAFGLDAVRTSCIRLIDLFLIEQTGELMHLHPFIQVFFVDELSAIPDVRDRMAADLGMYVYARAVTFARKSVDAQAISGRLDNEESIALSGSALRYAVPANRLLRIIGREDLADTLPIEIKGSIREMVFYFFQERRDYQTALIYAERWLTLVPNDAEIVLFRARCYRNFRDTGSLRKAEGILDDLDSFARTPYFKARLLRDKALVQQHLGNRQRAKELFNDGIVESSGYTENHVGLAELLLKEAYELGEYDKKREALVRRAVSFLESARKKPNPIFDKLHLGLYIEALIEARNEEKAIPLLEDALEANPYDARLNHRMAEIQRKQGNFDDALIYSARGKKQGHPKIPLTEANIAYGKSQQFAREGNRPQATKMLDEALRILDTFVPEYGTDKEVADTIRAKIYRTMNRLDMAAETLSRYHETSNPYTIYELSRIELLMAAVEPLPDREAKIASVKNAIRERVAKYEESHTLPLPLRDLLDSFDTGEVGNSEW